MTIEAAEQEFLAFLRQPAFLEIKSDEFKKALARKASEVYRRHFSAPASELPSERLKGLVNSFNDEADADERRGRTQTDQYWNGHARGLRRAANAIEAVLGECAQQSASAPQAVQGWRTLPARVLTMCNARGWSLHWTARGAYLHLESSELIEAVRGKHGNPKNEAADVLLVLMSITESAGIPWTEVVEQASNRCAELMATANKPYAGEERSPPLPAPAAPQAREESK